MSNSSLVDIVMISPNSSPRTAKIDKITIHHMAVKATAEACAASFMPKSREGSANYCIGYDGSVALSVDESRRAWTSSNWENDNRAVTIEVSNETREPDWTVPEKALEKLIDLCVDICKRNGIPKLTFTGDKSGNLTMHKFFANTTCPGPFLEERFPWIAEEVSRRLSGGANNPATTNPPKEESSRPGGSSGPVYRVQAGAFNRLDFAEKHLHKVKAAGFPDAIIAVVDRKLYRVQIGAFSQKQNAEAQLAKLLKAGFNGFVTKNGGEVLGEIEVGSLVRVKAGAKDWTGGSLASFVYERNHTVKSINGDRVVITWNGVVVAAVKKENLILV